MFIDSVTGRVRKIAVEYFAFYPVRNPCFIRSAQRSPRNFKDANLKVRIRDIKKQKNTFHLYINVIQIFILLAFDKFAKMFNVTRT